MTSLYLVSLSPFPCASCRHPPLSHRHKGSSVSLASFHPSAFSLRLSVSFCLFIIRRTIFSRPSDAPPLSCSVLLFRSHLVRRVNGARWRSLCLPMCRNLIFSFDLVKRRYLEYMRLFKFMRSDGVLSVIGITFLKMPSRLICDNNMISVSVRARMASVLHTTRTSEAMTSLLLYGFNIVIYQIFSSDHLMNNNTKQHKLMPGSGTNKPESNFFIVNNFDEDVCQCNML